MRTIRVPSPDGAWGITVRGPVSPSVSSIAEARSMLDDGLASASELDTKLQSGDWCVVWGSATLHAGPLLKRWVWIDRPDRAIDLADAVAALLEHKGFIARRAPRPGLVDAALRPRVLYLRAGSVTLGLGTDARSALERVDIIDEPRAGIDLGLRFRFRRQGCPVCGAVDHPMQLIGGFPNPDLLLAVALGEVALSGCDVDPTSRENARCRNCGSDFVAR